MITFVVIVLIVGSLLYTLAVTRPDILISLERYLDDLIYDIERTLEQDKSKKDKK